MGKISDYFNLVTATDDSLQEHDKRFHPDGYREGETCNKRNAMSKDDKADSFSDESGKSAKQLITPEEDAAYMEAVKNGDMDTAMKMVREAAVKAMPDTNVADEDGVPLIVYHGTCDGRINRFDMEKHAGAWFSYDKTYAEESYTNRHVDDIPDSNFLYGCFVDAKRPLDVGDVNTNLTEEDISNFSDGLNLNNDQYEYLLSLAEGIGYREDGEYGYGSVPQIWELTRLNGFHEICKEQGFDSISSIENDGETKCICLFRNSNQIKSADPVTYDDKGNVVPLSKRFDDDDDIRGKVK